MELLASIASALDFAEALDDSGRRPMVLTRRTFALFARQASSGAVITLREPAHGALVMIMGLYPWEGWSEAWFAVGPAMRANATAALRLMKRFLDQVGGDSAPLSVRCHVRSDSVAGDRVARLLGFQSQGRQALPGWGDVTLWTREF